MARRSTCVAAVLLPPLLAVVLVVVLGYGPAEWVFFTGCLGAATAAGWLVRRSAVRSARQQVRAEALSRVTPEAAVQTAVLAERSRLSAEISAELTALLGEVRDLARSGDPSAAPEIHRLARRAVSDLRRQLGLLRDPPAAGTVPPQPALVRVRPADVALGLGVSGVAALEAWGYPRGEGLTPLPGSVLLTAAVALTVIGLRAHTAPAAVLAGVLQLVGLALGIPVTHGFWILASVAAPVGSLLARPPRARHLLAAGVLVGGTVLSGALTSTENLGVLVAILALAGAAGLWAGHWSRREAVARSLADRRAAELSAAATAAVEAQRIAYAQEIHDTVAHAVGVIAMQASVAQVAGRSDAGEAMDRIREVAGLTLAELTEGATSVATAGSGRTDTVGAGVGGILAVVDRLRDAGMSVTVRGLDELPPGWSTLAYRIIQEGLTNVARHAPGASAVVTVSTQHDGTGHPPVLIEITDDGPGPRSAEAPGYGLVGLRERVGDVGGSVELVSRPEGGCGLRIRLPAPTIEVR